MKIGRAPAAVRRRLVETMKADKDSLAEAIRRVVRDRNDAHRRGNFGKVRALAERETYLRRLYGVTATNVAGMEAA